jgi:dTDP-4-amino-4,6-dideoxygalactose transaminase
MTVAQVGEIAPSAGLNPHLLDLLAYGHQRILEEAICSELRLPAIEIVNTGTAAIFVALSYLKRNSPERTKVIIPGYTCPLVVSAIAAAGLQAVPCDLVANGFDLEPAHLQRLVDHQTLAVLPTHYGGVVADVDRVRSVASAISPPICIIEDAAQAFGATWQGQSVGIAGDIGIFSFGAGKGFTIYEGGALIARDPSVMTGLRQTAKELATTSPLSELRRALLLVGYHLFYNPVGLWAAYGIPKRFWLARGDEMHAANDIVPLIVAVHPVGRWRKSVGAAALSRLSEHLSKSRDRFFSLAARVGALPGLQVHLPLRGALPSATSLFVTLPQTRGLDTVIRELWASRLGVTKMFSRAIGDYPHLAAAVQPTETPNARILAATTITISTHNTFGSSDETYLVSRLEQKLAELRT